jgi:hypothetical protein
MGKKSLGNKSLWIDRDVLNKVERLADIVGHGTTLQQSLNHYNDDDLYKILSSLPGTNHG